MKIHGLQKMTLLDFPSRVACTVFTGGCNMRCPFCHNALLVTDIKGECEYTEEYVLDFLSKRKGLLDGVCITGGEPLINPDIPEFIKKIKALGFAVKLDTNGTNPEMLEMLIKEGLVDYVAMDIKNCREKYALTAGVLGLDISKIERSIEILKSSSIDFEFRTTVVREFHTVKDIAAAAEWIGGAPKYFLQAFTDSGNLIGENMNAVSKEEMTEMCNAAKRFVENTQIRGI